MSCSEEKDFIEHQSKKYSIKQYNWKEANKISKFKESSTQIFKTLKKNNVKSNNKTILGFEVDENIVKEISTEEYTSYNMLIIRDEQSQEYFENLVIEIKNDTTSAYLVKYTPTTAITINESNINGDFNGTIEALKVYGQTCIICPTNDDSGHGPIETGGAGVCVTIYKCYTPDPLRPGLAIPHIAYSSNCDMIPFLSCNGSVSPFGNGGAGYGPNVGPGGGGLSSGSNTQTSTTTNPVVVPVLPPPPSPCETLNELTNPAKANGKPNIDWLVQHALNPVNIVEHGTEFELNNYSSTYTNTNVTSTNQNEVELYVGGDIYGSAHHHTINGHEIPSFGDLEQLAEIYKKATTPNKNIVVSIIVCKTGNTINIYALKVNDITALENAIKAEYRKHNTSPNPKVIILEEEGVIYNESNGEYEKTFLNKYKDIGISLYKTDTNMQNWNKLEVLPPDPMYPNTNTEIVKLTPCVQK